MTLESYAVACDACQGHGYRGRFLCLKCEGNGNVLITAQVSLWQWLKDRVAWMRYFSWQ